MHAFDYCCKRRRFLSFPKEFAVRTRYDCFRNSASIRSSDLGFALVQPNSVSKFCMVFSLLWFPVNDLHPRKEELQDSQVIENSKFDWFKNENPVFRLRTKHDFCLLWQKTKTNTKHVWSQRLSQKTKIFDSDPAHYTIFIFCRKRQRQIPNMFDLKDYRKRQKFSILIRHTTRFLSFVAKDKDKYQTCLISKIIAEDKNFRFCSGTLHDFRLLSQKTKTNTKHVWSQRLSQKTKFSILIPHTTRFSSFVANDKDKYQTCLISKIIAKNKIFDSDPAHYMFFVFCGKRQRQIPNMFDLKDCRKRQKYSILIRHTTRFSSFVAKDKDKYQTCLISKIIPKDKNLSIPILQIFVFKICWKPFVFCYKNLLCTLSFTHYL